MLNRCQGIRVLAVGALVALLCLAAAGAAQTPNDTGRISFHTPNSPLGDVLRLLSERSGMNIIASPTVQATPVSIHLTDVPYAEALDLVIRAAGLSYERIGSSILVADEASLQRQTGLEVRVFKLQHAGPDDAKKALEVITANVRVDPGSGNIVVRGTPSELEQAAEVIAAIDAKPAQIMLEARLIEVNRSRLSEVGIDWEKITKWSSVITEGYQGTSPDGQLPGEIDYVKLDHGDDFYRQMATFELAIDALVTDGSAKLLANSKVVTLDGQPAEIFAGETIPVVITSLQTPGGAGGVFQTVQLEKIDVGVRLNITPSITDGDFVTALVQPEISRIIGFVGPDDDLPQTSTRRARTLVRVHDGEKIYMGGLLTEEKRKTVKKVPLLGSLPLLGAIFRHSREEVIRLDLIIEITPHIVGDSGATLPVVDLKKLLNEPGLDLPDTPEADRIPRPKGE